MDHSESQTPADDGSSKGLSDSNTNMNQSSSSESSVPSVLCSSLFKMPFVGSLARMNKKISSSSTAAFDNSDNVKLLSNDQHMSEPIKVLCEVEKSSDTIKIEESMIKIEKLSEDESDTNHITDIAVKNYEKSKLYEKAKKCMIPSPSENSDYKEPSWGGGSDEMYYFETVKNGIVTDKYDLTTKSFHIFGRLPTCDHPMDHPSLSRHHAIIQHCSVATPTHAVGWYLYDLDSTHGTWINKHKVTPRVYCRLRVGYVVKFGGSTRLYILQGPTDDQDDESELSVSEMKAQRERQIIETDILADMEKKEAEELLRMTQRSMKDSGGCSWGFTEDDDGMTVEDSDAPNPFAAPDNETLYLDDPKKALRGYFEREGYEQPNYEFTDEGKGKFRCYVELPIDGPDGKPIVADVTTVGKKKDLVVAVALEACRILDRLGELRKAEQGSRGKKRKNWEDTNYYDSDEDSYWDRTGELEKKREKRIMRVHKTSTSAETFESLTLKLNEALSEKESIEKRLADDKEARASVDDEGLDELDAFMMSMKTGHTLDVATKTHMKHRVVILRQQVPQLERLVQLAKPTVSLDRLEATKVVALPTVGRMKRPVKSTRTMLAVPQAASAAEMVADLVEEEEEEDEDINNSQLDTVTKLNAVSNCLLAPDGNSKGSTTQSPEVPVATQSPKVLIAPTKYKEASVKVELAQVLSLQPSQIEPVTSVDIPVSFSKNGASGLEKTLKSAQKTPNIYEAIKIEMAEKLPKVEVSVDPKYNIWLPPMDQSGDGKNALNKKLGY